MKRALLVLGLLAARAGAQVILSEVMFNPRGNENHNEFVELFNASVTDSVSLAGWRIGDQAAVDNIVAWRAGLVLRPQQFAVILDPTYFSSSTQYQTLIPAEALVVTISDNAFGSGGFSNSTAETVILLNAAGDTVAQYLYSPGNPDGISDEKIELTDDDGPANWADALSADGTPGARNSVMPGLHDAGLVPGSLQIEPAALRAGTAARVRLRVRNHGLAAIATFKITLHLMPARPEYFAPVSPGEATFGQSLGRGEETEVALMTVPLPAGEYILQARLSLADDSNARNDALDLPVAIGWPRQTIVINEIMFAPAGGRPEWLELYNPQSHDVPLQDWWAVDEAGSRAAVVENYSIPARSLRVLTASRGLAALYHLPEHAVLLTPAFPLLNNAGDLIVLRDFSGAVIDSVFYEGDWGEAGKSIEKIWYERDNSRRNWLPSRGARGATPADFNSVSPREYDLQLELLSFLPARPRAGEPVRLTAGVFNRGRRALENFTVHFFHDPVGTQDATLLEELGAVTVSQALAAEQTIMVGLDWPQPPSGINRVMAEAREPRDLVMDNNRTMAEVPVGYAAHTLVINEIYYAPRSGEVEWFELFNLSNAPVNLRRWRWRDADAEETASLPDSTLILLAGGFAVVAAAGTLPNPGNTAVHVVPSRWLTLNNDRERLSVWDFNGGWQDSVAFRSTWGGAAGFSLERINPRLPAQDSSNWSTCVAAAGATPGRQNSVFTAILPSAATLSISPNPFSPDDDGIADFAICQLNLPVATASVHVKIYDLRGRLVRWLLNNRPVGSNFQVVWDGRDENGRLLRSGVYLVFLQAVHGNSGRLLSAKTTVVLARPVD
ncbi:MAG: lamin tail domain-containing protein [candidate division KSB1 bacterium]|nr:lamin tail domain-containing protein [candidate division KSB1 bacterium]MDZ7272941.1 lamin tail domain-containing protein [candidate division KSB1 bacterium]MDZ7284037.1 lamin tail domain-containing protein [candidate division KSB1 bacterium]MDZ7297566.1 lamin tail domain-containing protein [candidate division KSB1 bacterium]MDZ7308958.1 lamin tail domain-containing protein [candidate division KSB1 bacterium]